MSNKRSLINRYGLTRDVPAETAREIRRNAGFGCVRCGNIFTDYEHVDPEFKDARFHDPKCMTLLCDGCHGLVTRRLLPKAEVKKAMLKPWCKSHSFAKHYYEFAELRPTIVFGTVQFINCTIPILINGRPILMVEPPTEPGEPFLLSGLFCDSEGHNTLVIERNNARAFESNWDVESKGSRIEIRHAKRKICLILNYIIPNVIEIVRLDMSYLGYHILANKQGLRVISPNGGQRLIHNIIMDANVAIAISNQKGLELMNAMAMTLMED